jgi:hypothetical protein
LDNNVALAILVHEIYDPMAATDASTILKADEANEFQQLLSNLKQGQPIVLLLASPSNEEHAVVAWAAKENPDGTYAISIYDPNLKSSLATGIFDPSTNSFSYYQGNFKTGFTTFMVVVPQPIQESWFNTAKWGWAPSDPLLKYWFDNSVSDYTIVIADKSVIVSSRGSSDSFERLGDSRTFMQNIDGSSGVSENNFEVYAIPAPNSAVSVSDPSESKDGIFLVMGLDNSSGQLVEQGCLFSVVSSSSLNYSIQLLGSNIAVSTPNALTLNITLFSATETKTAIFNSSNVSIPSAASADFRINWHELNEASQAPVTLVISSLSKPQQNETYSLLNGQIGLSQTNKSEPPNSSLYVEIILIVGLIVIAVISLLITKGRIEKKHQNRAFL